MAPQPDPRGCPAPRGLEPGSPPFGPVQVGAAAAGSEDQRRQQRSPPGAHALGKRPDGRAPRCHPKPGQRRETADTGRNALPFLDPFSTRRAVMPLWRRPAIEVEASQALCEWRPPRSPLAIERPGTETTDIQIALSGPPATTTARPDPDQPAPPLWGSSVGPQARAPKDAVEGRHGSAHPQPGQFRLHPRPGRCPACAPPSARRPQGQPVSNTDSQGAWSTRCFRCGAPAVSARWPPKG